MAATETYQQLTALQPGVIPLENGVPIVQQEGGASPVVDLTDAPYVTPPNSPGHPRTQGSPTHAAGGYPQAPLVPLPEGVTFPGEWCASLLVLQFE